MRRTLCGLLVLMLLPAVLRADTHCGSCDLPGSLTWAENLGFPSNTQVLILHADDAGMFQGGNDAIRDLLTDATTSKYIQSVSAMPPCKYYGGFYTWWQQNPSYDVGIHLTLNSEWTKTFALRWGSVTPATMVDKLLVDFPLDNSLKKDHLGTLKANAPGQVELELQNQHLAGVGDAVPSHFDSHMGTVWVRGSYYRNYLRLGRDNDIPSVTVRTRKKNIHFSGNSVLEPKGIVQKIVTYFLLRKVRKVQKKDENDNGWPLPRLDYYCRIPTQPSEQETVDGFIEFVETKLPDGLTQFFFHPNNADAELELSTNTWERRIWDAKIFTRQDVQDFFAAQNILFTNWTDIACRWACNPGNCVGGGPWVKPGGRCP